MEREYPNVAGGSGTAAAPAVGLTDKLPRVRGLLAPAITAWQLLWPKASLHEVALSACQFRTAEKVDVIAFPKGMSDGAIAVGIGR
jgi:hypothetical protein